MPSPARFCFGMRAWIFPCRRTAAQFKDALMIAQRNAADYKRVRQNRRCFSRNLLRDFQRLLGNVRYSTGFLSHNPDQKFRKNDGWLTVFNAFQQEDVPSFPFQSRGVWFRETSERRMLDRRSACMQDGLQDLPSVCAAVSGSTARSGCGIIPMTRPALSVMPAMLSTDPFTFSRYSNATWLLLQVL